MEQHDVTAIAESLVNERTVDIITTGRRSGQPRTIEIWSTVVDGEIYITGTPSDSPADVAAKPRDWLANLRAEPAFTLRLKTSVDVELPARATEVTDADVKRSIYEAPASEYYRANSRSVEQWIESAPMVHVSLLGDAAEVEATIRAQRANSPTI